MMKPYYNGELESVVDYVTQKVLISDTILRSFMPPQVRKMTPKLHQIYGCDIFITPKYMQIYLNRFRTIILIYLQHKYFGRHKRNILFITTSDENSKYIVFPEGAFFCATIRDAAQCIACIPIKPNNIIHIQYDYFL